MVHKAVVRHCACKNPFVYRHLYVLATTRALDETLNRLMRRARVTDEDGRAATHVGR